MPEIAGKHITALEKHISSWPELYGMVEEEKKRTEVWPSPHPFFHFALMTLECREHDESREVWGNKQHVSLNAAGSFRPSGTRTKGGPSP